MSIEERIKETIVCWMHTNFIVSSKSCEYDVNCEYLDNLDGWKIDINFKEPNKKKPYCVSMMMYGNENVDGIETVNFVPIKNRLSLSQSEADFDSESLKSQIQQAKGKKKCIEINNMYSNENAYAKAIEFQYKLMFDKGFSYSLYNKLIGYWFEVFGIL